MRSSAASIAAKAASGASLCLSRVFSHRRCHSISAAEGSRLMLRGISMASGVVPRSATTTSGDGKSAVKERTLHKSGIMAGMSMRNSAGNTSTSGQATSRSNRKRLSLSRDNTCHMARRSSFRSSSLPTSRHISSHSGGYLPFSGRAFNTPIKVESICCGCCNTNCRKGTVLRLSISLSRLRNATTGAGWRVNKTASVKPSVHSIWGRSLRQISSSEAW